MRTGYYPGCTATSTAKEYDLSVRAVAGALGVELVELPDWTCCGTSHHVNKQVPLALSARNLALAERQKLDLAVICPACFLRLRQTAGELQANGSLRREVEKTIGTPCRGETRVRHLLDIFYRDVGLEEVRSRVKRPLHGLKLVAYYGCYLVRPAGLTGIDDLENPVMMDDLMRALGAEVSDWSYKVECCGGDLSVARPDIAARLVDGISRAAVDAGASAIVTACPLCQINLDSRQSLSPKVPVFYFSELMGLALGVDERSVRSWLKRHMTRPKGWAQAVPSLPR